MTEKEFCNLIRDLSFAAGGLLSLEYLNSFHKFELAIENIREIISEQIDFLIKDRYPEKSE